MDCNTNNYDINVRFADYYPKLHQNETDKQHGGHGGS